MVAGDPISNGHLWSVEELGEGATAILAGGPLSLSYLDSFIDRLGVELLVLHVLVKDSRYTARFAEAIDAWEAHMLDRNRPLEVPHVRAFSALITMLRSEPVAWSLHVLEQRPPARLSRAELLNDALSVSDITELKS